MEVEPALEPDAPGAVEGRADRGRRLPGRADRLCLPGGAGTVEANLERWQKLFKDKDGNPPKIESKKVKGKNVEVTRAETPAIIIPPQFPGTPRSPIGRRPASGRDRHGRRDQLLHPDGRPRQDDEEASRRLRRDAQDDQAGRAK